MKLIITILCLALLGCVLGFAPAPVSRQLATKNANSKLQLPALPPTWQDEQPTTTKSASTMTVSSTKPTLAGLCTGLVAFASVAFAGEEIEMAELPPPWVPAIFAVILLVGVGALTAGLGNVIDEEASLGLQSGARARKEIERSKSSYFKKR